MRFGNAIREWIGNGCFDQGLKHCEALSGKWQVFLVPKSKTFTNSQRATKMRSVTNCHSHNSYYALLLTHLHTPFTSYLPTPRRTHPLPLPQPLVPMPPLLALHHRLNTNRQRILAYTT
jgi:hypothetical protein